MQLLPPQLVVDRAPEPTRLALHDLPPATAWGPCHHIKPPTPPIASKGVAGHGSPGSSFDTQATLAIVLSKLPLLERLYGHT
jgi:hypothetical protein